MVEPKINVVKPVHSQDIIDAVIKACNQTDYSFNDYFWSWLHQEAKTYLYDNDGSNMFLGMYNSLKDDPCDIGDKSEEDVIKTLITHAENDLGVNVLTPIYETVEST